MLEQEAITEKIISACLNVHKELGRGFLEPIYQEALAIEFGLQGIPFNKEAEIGLTYKGINLKKKYFADFICFDSVIVELKAVSALDSSHKAQVINYLKGTKMKIGLLVNFGQSSLKWERISNF